MGSSEPAFEDLFRAAQSAGAMEALLSRVYPALLGYATRLTLDKDLAEDVCQETMIRIITNLKRFRPAAGRAESSFRAWAVTIATNVYRDMLRKSSRTVPVEQVPDDANLLPASRRSETAEEIALESIRQEALFDALRVLSGQQRAAFMMRTYYGFTYREIGEACGCPEGTAKSRVHSAALAFRDELEKRGML